MVRGGVACNRRGSVRWSTLPVSVHQIGDPSRTVVGAVELARIVWMPPTPAIAIPYELQADV